MFVGAKGEGINGRIAVDDRRMGMAKAIVALRRKHGDSWLNGAHKGHATGGQAAMMRNLEDRGTQIMATLQQEALGFLLDVAGE